MAAQSRLIAPADLLYADFTSLADDWAADRGITNTTNLRIAIDAGTVAVGPTDRVVIINKTVGEATPVSLPASPLSGHLVTIKDGKGDADTHNITITPASGTIDGVSNAIIDTEYGVVRLVYNGTQWNII